MRISFKAFLTSPSCILFPPQVLLFLLSSHGWICLVSWILQFSISISEELVQTLNFWVINADWQFLMCLWNWDNRMMSWIKDLMRLVRTWSQSHLKSHKQRVRCCPLSSPSYNQFIFQSCSDYLPGPGLNILLELSTSRHKSISVVPLSIAMHQMSNVYINII